MVDLSCAFLLRIIDVTICLPRSLAHLYKKNFFLRGKLVSCPQFTWARNFSSSITNAVLLIRWSESCQGLESYLKQILTNRGRERQPRSFCSTCWTYVCPRTSKPVQKIRKLENNETRRCKRQRDFIFYTEYDHWKAEQVVNGLRGLQPFLLSTPSNSHQYHSAKTIFPHINRQYVRSKIQEKSALRNKIKGDIHDPWRTR